MLGDWAFAPESRINSRHIAGRPAGSRPTCIIDFFPRDYLLMIDESHRDPPADRWDVCRRHGAQDGLGGVRLSPAERAG